MDLEDGEEKFSNSMDEEKQTNKSSQVEVSPTISEEEILEMFNAKVAT